MQSWNIFPPTQKCSKRIRSPFCIFHFAQGELVYFIYTLTKERIIRLSLYSLGQPSLEVMSEWPLKILRTASTSIPISWWPQALLLHFVASQLPLHHAHLYSSVHNKYSESSGFLSTHCSPHGASGTFDTPGNYSTVAFTHSTSHLCLTGFFRLLHSFFFLLTQVYLYRCVIVLLCFPRILLWNPISSNFTGR